MPIRTIIVGLALEVDDDPVAPRALQLAQQHGARLIAVHVIENPIKGDRTLSPPVDQAAVVDILETEARARLQRMFADAASPVEIVVQAGKAHEVLDGLVSDHAADLLVIGPGKVQSIRDRLFGSTADRVVRSAPCPVLVVKRPVTAAYRRVVAAVDFSPSAAAAAHCVARLAPDALLDLVHAVEIPLPFEQAMLKAGTPQAEIDRYRRARASLARKKLQAVFTESDGLSERAKLRVAHGAAPRVLIRRARRRETDLIALGAQGASAVSRLVLGSVARKVLEAATCDVLIARG